MLTPVLLSSHPEYVGAARTLYEESFPESERVPRLSSEAARWTGASMSLRKGKK